MAARKKFNAATLAVAALAVALLVSLNPTMADFRLHYQKSAQTTAENQIGGGIGQLFGAMAKGVAGIAADAAFKRTNLFVASVYTSSSRDGKVQRAYLGIAKFFVKIK